jgi:hypothetical protein
MSCSLAGVHDLDEERETEKSNDGNKSFLEPLFETTIVCKVCGEKRDEIVEIEPHECIPSKLPVGERLRDKFDTHRKKLTEMDRLKEAVEHVQKIQRQLVEAERRHAFLKQAERKALAQLEAQTKRLNDAKKELVEPVSVPHEEEHLLSEHTEEIFQKIVSGQDFSIVKANSDGRCIEWLGKAYLDNACYMLSAGFSENGQKVTRFEDLVLVSTNKGSLLSGKILPSAQHVLNYISKTVNVDRDVVAPLHRILVFKGIELN